MIKKIKRELYSNLITLPLISKWLINWEFKIERELIKGSHKLESSDHHSILHFSLNKSATQYVKSILRRCALENNMVHVQINEYAFKSNFPFLEGLNSKEMQQYNHIFQPRGYLYSAFGGMVEGIPNRDDYYLVLVVRDPRDILTSSYFSIRYSHPLPRGKNKIESFNKKRYFAQNVDIDEYVLVKSDSVYQTYQRYVDLLVNKANHNVYITKYENMVANFPVWLDGLLNHCNLKITSELRQELISEAHRSQMKTEDITNHRRQVIPGDYQRKLKSQTIIQLNSSFSNILSLFEYA